MRYLNANAFAITFIHDCYVGWRAVQPRAGIGSTGELSSKMRGHLTPMRNYHYNQYWPECNTLTGYLVIGILARGVPDPKHTLERYSCSTIFSLDVAASYATLNDELVGLV